MVADPSPQMIRAELGTKGDSRRVWGQTAALLKFLKFPC